MAAVDTRTRPAPPAVTTTAPAPAPPATTGFEVTPARPPFRHFLATDLAALATVAAFHLAHPAFALVAAAMVVAGLGMGHLYRATTAPSALDELSTVMRGVAFAALVAGALTGTSAGAAAGYAVLATAAVTLARAGLYARTRRAVARHPRRAIMIGTGAAGQELAERLLEHPEYGLVPLGFLDDDPQPVDPTLPIVPVGRIADLPTVVHRLRIDRVIVDAGSVDETEVLDALDHANRLGVEVTVLPHLAQHLSSQVQVESLAGTTLLSYRPSRHSGLAWGLKRAVDVVGSVTMLLVLAPLMATVAMAIKATSPGPVLFAQERVGRSGRRFRIYKFRSMVTDAEDRLEELLELNEADGPYFKLGTDPRVTPIGRFIRALSIDELPQLFNVLKGEMSLVGPRPALPHEVEQYPGWFRRRLNVPPGLTGLWQVSGRYLLSFGETTRLDVSYVDHWSLGLDLKILARTPHVVLSGKGAK